MVGDGSLGVYPLGTRSEQGGVRVNGGWDEKRRARRVDANLNLEVQIPQGDGSLETANLETINISSSGVYFRSDKFLEPMTKLAMRLDVTVPGTSGEGTARAPVACEGIVVRPDPDVERSDCEQYETAVFFTNISPEGLTNLERHIAYLLDGD